MAQRERPLEGLKAAILVPDLFEQAELAHHDALVQGRTLTSWPSLQDDIRNAGGSWVDRELVAAIARAPELSANPMPITE